jgi:hypothetical protein
MVWRLHRSAARLQAERVDLQQLMQAHGPGSQGAMLMFLAAPCALPVPGVGTLLGWAILALAWAMWRGHAFDQLPERVARVSMPRIWARRVLGLLVRVYATSGRLSRPRWQPMACTQRQFWLPWLVAWLAFLIILPIPFGNVLPAISLILMGIGLVFLDGLLVVAGAAVAALATAFPLSLGVAAMIWGPAVVRAWLPA